METRTLRLLELDKVLARLEGQAASDLGRARIAALKPVSRPEEARRRLAETTEARRFLDSGAQPIFGGVRDVSELLQRAAIHAVLEAEELLQVAQLAHAASRLRELILRHNAEEFPLLRARVEWLAPQPAIEKAILSAIDETSGELKDDASLRLLKARRNMRQAQNDVQDRLRRMLSDPNVQPALQDAFVTVRDGRYCLPVRADRRSQVPGIVHDRSNSGAALFVEPQAVVELNNRIRELMGEEREAILEILSNLSSQVGVVHEDLKNLLEAAGDLDFWFAKARLSRAMNAIEALIDDDPKTQGLCLLQARHPLIESPIANDIYIGSGCWKLEAEDSPPLPPRGHPLPTGRGEISSPSGGGRVGEMASTFDVLLITGPNTGGKTVVLKTLGLLALMSACGLHIPAKEGSRIAIPGAIYADIGDEQSIEQSLSTFSSHLKQIVHILRRAGAGDLVLLDEIGAGTDPDEGAALAKAVLRALARRGVRVMATTHYGELKQFALSAERFKNASVEFDAKTLRPTYRLRIGVPGASNALDIASRLGMPPELVQRARRYLGKARAEAETATQRLEETQRELEEQRLAAAHERAEAERLRRDYEKRLAKLEARLDKEIEEAQREAAQTVRQAQDEANAILRELRSATSGGRESKQTEDARRRLKTMRERVEAEADKKPVRAVTPSEKQILDPFPENGETVLVRSLNREGTLLSQPRQNKVEVRVGALKMQIQAHDIERTDGPKITAGGVAAIRLSKAINVPEELNLIGKTTDEALPELEKYLDDAILAEAEEVRIVHGRGSGALRALVQRILKSTRAVREFHQAPPHLGGEGATIATLK
ncbi:MAG TPA: Smr/MutS family protein [Abditibacteriaceae bacterium]|jgi:DNA mismatch repair protein MutS2